MEDVSKGFFTCLGMTLFIIFMFLLTFMACSGFATGIGGRH